MARKKWDGRIPWYNGGLQSYPEDWAKGFRWRENEPFPATLRFNGFTRGRSAARARFTFSRDRRPVRGEMFLKTFSGLVPLLQEGKITGMWKVEKVGQNFGLFPCGPIPDPLE